MSTHIVGKQFLVSISVALSTFCSAGTGLAAEIPGNVQKELDQGQELMDKCDWFKASEVWIAALQKLRSANWDKKALADLYAKYGDQCVKQRAWTEARPLMNEAAILYEQTETLSPRMASFYENLANANELGAEPDATAGEKARRKALGLLIFENGATSPAIVDQLQLLALNRYFEKDYKNAAVLYAYESGLLYMARPDLTQLAGCLSQLGQCFENQGHWHCAEQIYKQALSHYRKTGKQDLELAQYANQYGRALSAMGQKPEGEKLIEEATALRQRLGAKNPRENATRDAGKEAGKDPARNATKNGATEASR